MKKKKKGSTFKKHSFLEKYNQRETKGNIQNTLLKGTVDTLASVVLGTGIGAVTGNRAPLAGVALILTGHYLGDRSGVMRLTGASTMAYGIGKAKEYKTNPEMNSPSKRLGGLKKDLLGVFFQKWQEEKVDTPSEGTILNVNGLSSKPIHFEEDNDSLRIEPKDAEEANDITELDGYSELSQIENTEKSIQITSEYSDHEDDKDLSTDEFDGIDLTLI